MSAADPDALHGSFQFYRAIHTIAQNEQRKERPLTLPVLAIGGAESSGDMVADSMKLVADDVQGLVIPAAGTGSPSRRPRSCWRRWPRSWPRTGTGADRGARPQAPCWRRTSRRPGAGSRPSGKGLS
jgi:hypothetical protein